MKNWKIVLNKFFILPVWLMIILAVISAAALAAVFIKDLETSPIAYIIYVIAFYSVVVISIACYFTFPKYYKTIKKKIYDNKYGNRYMTDIDFKTHVSLYRSLAVNLLYVAANIFWGIWYNTAWFVIFAVYYIILSVMRFLLLRYVSRNEIGKNRFLELKRSRICAAILLMINLVLSGAVLMMLYQNRGFEYQGILIYVMALYTFYMITIAIVHMVKYRKYNSPVISMTNIISLAAALVSMLSLETAMLTQFGAENSKEFRRIMIAATGAGVSMIIVGAALFMIIRANKEIKAMKL